MTTTRNKDRWDLDSIYPSFHAWNHEYNEVETKINDFIKYKNTIKDNLLKPLLNIIDIERVISKLYVYAKMNYDVNTLDENANKLINKVLTLSDKFTADTNFMDLEILKLNAKNLNNQYTKYPDLLEYKPLIDKIRAEKKHFLTAKEENIMALTGTIRNTNARVFSKLNDSDAKFGEIDNIELTHGNYSNYIRSKDLKVRRKAFNLYHEYYKNHCHTLAECLITEVKNNIFVANIRKYNDPLSMYLDSDKIKPKVYEKLIKSVNANLSLFHDYLMLKKEVLNITELHMYDLYVSLNHAEDKDYSYEEAKTIVIDSLKPMGEEYVSVVREGLSNNWVDVYPGKGKTSGAYSFGHYETKPYILMNYNNTLNAVETLTHELGHSMHSYYSRMNNQYHYSDYSIFVAEIASNTHELLLFDHLLHISKDKEEKLHIIETILESFKGSIFRQTQFAEFEKIIHELELSGEVLTANMVLDTYYDLNNKYYGKIVTNDELIKYEALRIPHFYSSFYVYKYALGLAIAYVFAKRIINKEENAVENYLNFLKAGSKDYPLQVLAQAGINLDKQDVIKEAMELFMDYLAEYKRIMKGDDINDK